MRGRARSGADRERAPWLDLQLRLVDEETGDTIARFGGKWDREARAYTGLAEKSRTISLHPGQIDAAYWFCDWLDAWLRGEPPPGGRKIFDLIFSGGRRGGKSAEMFTLGVAFALAVPGVIVCVVTPSDAFYAEPIKYLETIMPPEWYTSLGAPHWTYYLANGSQIVIRSGQTAKRQKQGQIDLYLINEGQAVPTQSYTTLSAGVVDSGGLIITAANPPDVGDPGEWVTDVVVGAERGDLVHAKHFHFDPLDNPHIDQEALAALAAKMDPHTFDVQVRGMFLNRPDTVLHTWSRADNEKTMPQLGDCTRQFTKQFEGREYSEIISVDVQNFPWIAGVRMRAFRNPLAPDDMSQAFLWGVGESFLGFGDEIDTARDFKKQGVNPRDVLTIMDASCDWQQAERDNEKQRSEFRGKGSMDMFRAEGFLHVVPPDTRMKSNPDIIDRVRAALARIGSKAGTRYVFLDPAKCPRTVESIRKWKSGPSGIPARRSKHAHGGDALTYAIWRFFPRRTEKNKVDIEAIKRFGGSSRMKGFR